jgi:hypothetical protein
MCVWSASQLKPSCWAFDASARSEGDMELFDRTYQCLPMLNTDETLFSWVTKYHRRSGNISTGKSIRHLFGSQRAGLSHDFPCCIDDLQIRTRQVLGRTEDLIFHHTLFGLFAKFLDETRLAECVGHLQANRGARIKPTLGIRQSRLGATHPLKACPVCMLEDEAEGYLTWWHLSHQFPSVWICAKHCAPLRSLRKTPKEWHHFWLPQDIAEVEWIDHTCTDDSQLAALRELALWTEHLAATPSPPIDSRLLRFTYLLGAKNQGWMSPDGTFRSKEVRQQVIRKFEHIQRLAPFSFINGARTEHGGFVGLLTREHPGYHHPSKHIILMSAIFDEIATFEQSYCQVAKWSQVGGDEALRDHIAPIHRNLVRMVRELVIIKVPF